MGIEADFIKMRLCKVCKIEAYSDAWDLVKHAIGCRADQAIKDRLDKLGLV